jgi:hypothetical protein
LGSVCGSFFSFIVDIIGMSKQTQTISTIAKTEDGRQLLLCYMYISYIRLILIIIRGMYVAYPI